MKLVADSGLWSTGPVAVPSPVLAVLEVSGAILSWTIDDESDSTAITFTDPARADWLWRVVGESGHSAVATAVAGHQPDRSLAIELAGVALLPGSLDSVRRLALGHWLRRWWPASHRDGIAVLDAAVLDAEIALLTAAAQDFFADDTFDSDVEGLLAPHTAAFGGLVLSGDPRVVEMVRAASELTDDVGFVGTEPAAVGARRDDYALAAGAESRVGNQGVMARGTDSLRWGGVPPSVFDAAEDTVDWRIEAADAHANATVTVDLAGAAVSANGIAVRLRSGDVVGAGVLDANGEARFPLAAGGQPVTETAAWNHDWRPTAITVGVDVEESPLIRERVRRFARARLAEPASDAFLAEVLAAEADY